MSLNHGFENCFFKISKKNTKENNGFISNGKCEFLFVKYRHIEISRGTLYKSELELQSFNFLKVFKQTEQLL